MMGSKPFQVVTVTLLLLGVAVAALVPTAAKLVESPQLLADFTLIAEDGQWRVPLLEVCFDETTGELHTPQGMAEWVPTLVFGDCNASFLAAHNPKVPHNPQST